MSRDDFDASLERGRCDTCGDSKSLDTMVMKERKGLYHCVDCEAERYTMSDVVLSSGLREPVHAPKMSKLMGWCFG